MLQVLSEHLEKYQLYRRLIVAYAGILVLYVTIESVRYAFAALDIGKSDLDIAGNIAAMQMPAMTVLGYVVNKYWSGRKTNEQ